jgi:hypothetical protein
VDVFGVLAEGVLVEGVLVEEVSPNEGVFVCEVVGVGVELDIICFLLFSL